MSQESESKTEALPYPIKRRIKFRKISGRSKIPYLTINHKMGAVFINKKGLDVSLFKKGDIIGFYEIDGGLYLKLAKDESEGFGLYSYGNGGRTLGFSNKEAVDWIFKKFNIKPSNEMFRLEINNTVDEGVFYLTKMQ